MNRGESIDRRIRSGLPIYGIWDVEGGAWILDCFDDPRLFFDAGAAEDYRTSCRDYDSPRFEVREWRRD